GRRRRPGQLVATSSTADPWDPPAAHGLERLVRALERERLDHRPDRHLRREREKLLAVTPRQVGDRAQHPLFPKELVRERWDVRHVDAGADDAAALRKW